MKTDQKKFQARFFLIGDHVTILVLNLLVLIGACHLKTSREYKRDGVVLRPQSKFTIGPGGISQMKLHHPAVISEKIIRNHLLSLRYQELTLFGKKKSLYYPEDVDQLAPLISKGLDKVSTESILFHQIDGKRGRIAGDVFYSKGQIHWRFHTISGIDFSNQRLKQSAFRKGQSTFWKMSPRKGQSYFKSNKLGLEITWENWIVSDLKLPNVKLKVKTESQLNTRTEGGKTQDIEKNNTQEYSQPPSKPSLSLELEEKLQILKNLNERGLVDKAEFDRKRKELLDKYL